MSTNGQFVVAIGASAGGLEAIHSFFDNMPPNADLSFLIVQHLSADHKSLLVDLISRHTHMQVAEAAHRMKIKKNCVYVIPNNKILTIAGGTLHLQPRSEEKAPSNTINLLFRSMAAELGPKAIAVVLSGTGSDGTEGVIDIHDKSGLVLVQDPVTAKFDGMPRSAINTGIADIVVAPESMPDEIISYVNDLPTIAELKEKPEEKSIPELTRLIEKHCQLDFTHYKSPTLLRRVIRRMGLLGFRHYHDYLQLLRQSPEECKELGQEFLIGVTRFFRDRHAFNALREDILVPLIRSKEDGDTLKIWIMACSTGEEAYSVAMMIDDVLQHNVRRIDIKIFATDLDSNAVAFASRGVYDAAAMKEIDPGFLKKYFIEEKNSFHIVPHIRKQVVFARHNILKDPPFIKNDLVCCRNMLIYLNSTAQRKAVSVFQFSLKVGGYLFLGPSESAVKQHDGFKELNSKWKLYQKETGKHAYLPGQFDRTGRSVSATANLPQTVQRETYTAKDLSEDFKNILIEKYSFACLYIDDNYEIREAIGDYRRYLSLPEKNISLNILKMVGKSLSASLNAAIRKAKKEECEVALSNVKVHEEGEQHIHIFIRPLPVKGQVLLLLSEAEKPVFSVPSVQPQVFQDQVQGGHINELQEELKETRQNLQLAIESLEASNEELQSSNEELLSANEELQSSNEELQSLNEELHTLNTEHQSRIKELIELNDDLDNYFSSTDIAQIFVDGDFRIRKFNPVAVRMINLIESDIGRPIVHISTNIRESQDFIEQIVRVIQTRVPFEKEVQLVNGTVNLMRIMPFVRRDKKVDGVVITFVDITSLARLNNIIRSVFNATLSAVMAFRAIRNKENDVTDLRWIAANYAADGMLQMANEEYMGKSITEIFPQFKRNGFFEQCAEVVKSGKPFRNEMKLAHNNLSDWYDVMAAPMSDGIVISFTNINDKKKTEESLRRNYQELIKSKENYRNLNLQLEQKIRERTFELSVSEERFRHISAAVSDAIWDRDLVQDSIWWSESFFKWFGYKNLPDQHGVSFQRDIIHPDDREIFNNAINTALNEGSDWQVIYRMRKQDGHYVPVLEKGTILKDENGIPYRLIGAITDQAAIELSRQNEALRMTNAELEVLVQQRTAALEEQRANLQNLFMQAPAMICTLRGPDHIYELVNPSYQELFGDRELVGKSISDAMPEIRGQGIIEILDEVYQTGKPYVGKEVRVMLARGEGRPVEDIYFNFIYQATRNEKLEVDGILVFAYDVSEHVKDRAALQAANTDLLKVNHEFKFVTDFVPQMVWSTMPDGYLDFCNKGWYDYTGQTLEESQGEGWAAVLHPADHQRTLQVWRHSLQTGESYEIEYRLRRFDGEFRWFLGRGLPLKDENGVIRKWIGTCTDIHDQKQMNDVLEQKIRERTVELSKINDELEQSNSELLQFASIASHDLKEPLRKIHLFTSFIMSRHQSELSTEALGYMNKIHASSTRMTALVNDLLSFTKLSVGSHFERMDLDTILAEVISDLELTITEKNAVIHAGSLPVAEVIPGQMRQVFQNIISNSLKFHRADTQPVITISAELVRSLSFTEKPASQGEYCRIIVEDNGIGFENQYEEKIFTIFQRLHTKNRYEGTGIGLAIARKIITIHKGVIRAEGRLNEGARFTIVIPLMQHKHVAF